MRYLLTITLLCYSLLTCLTSEAQTGWKWGIKNTGRGGLRSWPSAVDATGKLYLAGSTYGSAFTIDSMVFGPHTVYGSGSNDQMIITKVDTGGHYLWAIGSTGSGTEPLALATDPSGNIFIVGVYSGSSVTLGSVTLANSSSSDMFFIEKVSSSGTVLWAQNIFNSHGGFSPIGLGVGTDGVGNAYVTGNFYQYMLLFGSSILTNHDPSGFTSDILLLKYNSAGALKWARSFGGNHADYPFIQGNYAGFDYCNNIMSVTPDGSIYLTGVFYSDSIAIGSTTLYNPFGGTTQPGPTYSYLSKWDSSGNAIWAKHVERKMLVNEITSNARGEVFFAGSLDSADTWGSFALNPGAVVAKLDSSGSLAWAHSYPGGDAMSIGLDDSGKIFVTGNLSDSMTFGSSVLHAPAVHVAPMFVARYDSSGAYVNSTAIAGGGGISCAIRADKLGGYYLAGNMFGVPLAFGTDVIDTAGILSEATFIARYQYIPPAIIITPTENPIEYTNADGRIVMYPNPANDILYVKSQDRMYLVDITDMLGRRVYSVECDDSLLKIKVSNIPAGVYLIRVNNMTAGKFLKE